MNLLENIPFGILALTAVATIAAFGLIISRFRSMTTPDDLIESSEKKTPLKLPESPLNLEAQMNRAIASDIYIYPSNQGAISASKPEDLLKDIGIVLRTHKLAEDGGRPSAMRISNNPSLEGGLSPTMKHNSRLNLLIGKANCSRSGSLNSLEGNGRIKVGESSSLGDGKSKSQLKLEKLNSNDHLGSDLAINLKSTIARSSSKKALNISGATSKLN